MSARDMLLALPLLAAVALPGAGEVRRSSLFGFTFGDGATLELDEAAARAEVEPQVGGLDVAANDVGEPEDDEPACSGPCEDGRPCLACVEALEADTDALMVEMGYGEWNVTDDAPPAIEDEPAAQLPPPEPPPTMVLPPLPVAQVRLCPACDGGRKRSCLRCDGRCVRLWVDTREITRRAPPTEPSRLAAALALSSLLPEIIGNAKAMRGAQELFSVTLAGCAPLTRELALMRWTTALA